MLEQSADQSEEKLTFEKEQTAKLEEVRKDSAALMAKMDDVIAVQTRLRGAFADMFKLVRGLQDSLEVHREEPPAH